MAEKRRRTRRPDRRPSKATGRAYERIRCPACGLLRGKGSAFFQVAHPLQIVSMRSRGRGRLEYEVRDLPEPMVRFFIERLRSIADRLENETRLRAVLARVGALGLEAASARPAVLAAPAPAVVAVRIAYAPPSAAVAPASVRVRPEVRT